MPMNKASVSALMLSTLACMSVDADCIRNEAVQTINLDMVIGRVVVLPDAPIGAVLASRQWSMAGASTVYTCTGVNTFEATIVAGGLQELANKIFASNIPGIGLRFRRGGEVQMTYPDSLTLNPGGRYSVRLAGSTFTLEVIKTAAVTGSGRVASGPYTSYDYSMGNNPLLTSSLSADALTIVSPSCLVSGGNNQNVDIGTIRQNELSGRGSVAGGRRFALQLQCSGGVSLSGFANVNMSFDGTLAAGTTAAQGVLTNEASGSRAAQGVGVQVLHGNQAPLEMGARQQVGRLESNETRYIDLEYIARFYQYLDTISAGDVRSHMVFNIDYD